MELKSCDVCYQLTNHDNDGNCLKCKVRQEKESSILLNKIERARVESAENAVVENLRRKGLA